MEGFLFDETADRVLDVDDGSEEEEAGQLEDERLLARLFQESLLNGVSSDRRAGEFARVHCSDGGFARRLDDEVHASKDYTDDDAGNEVPRTHGDDYDDHLGGLVCILSNAGRAFRYR